LGSELVREWIHGIALVLFGLLVEVDYLIQKSRNLAEARCEILGKLGAAGTDPRI